MPFFGVGVVRAEEGTVPFFGVGVFGRGCRMGRKRGQSPGQVDDVGFDYGIYEEKEGDSMPVGTILVTLCLSVSRGAPWCWHAAASS